MTGRLAFACVASLALAACGGDDSGDAESTVAPVTTAAGSAATAADQGATTSVDDTATSAAETPATTAAAATTAGPATTVGDGATFTPPGGDYSISFPGEPTERTQSVPLPDGTTIDVPFYLVEDDDGTAFTATSIEYPAGTVADLEGARDGALRAVGAPLVSSDPIEQQGRDGLEITADLGEQARYFSRLFAADRRLYQLQVVIGDSTATVDDPRIAEFFDSFEFTEDG